MLPNGTATPLRPGDFSFAGFDDLQRPLEQWLGDVGIRRGQPVATTVEDALFVPPSEVGRGEYEGALLTRDGGPIATAQAHRRYGAFGDQIIGTLRQPVPLDHHRVVDEEVVYLGWYYGHFGHFLLESLARTWILDQIDPSTKVVFHVERASDLAGVTLRMLAAFGVPLERVLLLDRQTRLRRVVAPEPLYEISYAAHERMPLAYRRVAATIVGGGDPAEQPLYLSRRLLPSIQRPIVGEFELEEVLRENGFLVAHPETMSFEDQVRLVNRHRHVFSYSGSTAYLPLFSVRPASLHVLTPGIPFQDYFLVSKVATAEATFVNCLRGENRPSHYFLPPLVDIAAVADYLESRGFLRRRLRASLASRLGSLQPRYDEARLYAYVLHGIRRDSLPPEVETEALDSARRSWPLSWILAGYYAPRDPDRTDELARNFAALVAEEADLARLAHFHQDVTTRSRRISRHCSAETATLLADVLADRFGIDLAEARERPERRARDKPRREPGAKRRGGA